jgi:hypothetical protein
MPPDKRTILEVWVGERQEPKLVNCLESPTDEEINEQLRLLPGGDQISSIEVHVSKTHFLAVGGSVTEGFSAKYREFSRTGEWESVREDLPFEVIRTLLRQYRDQKPAWKGLVGWQRRSVTDVLEANRKDRETTRLVSWIAKVIGFGLGVGDAFRHKPGPHSAGKRKRH